MFQAAAARHLHARHGDRRDVVGGEQGFELLAVVDAVELGAADKSDAPAHEAAMEVGVGERRTVCGDQHVRAREIRRLHGRELDLHRPLRKLGGRFFANRFGDGGGSGRPGGLRLRIFGREEARERSGTAARQACDRILLRRSSLDRSLVVGCRLALHERDGAGRARGQTVAQPVAIVVAQQARLALHQADGALMARRDAQAAAVAGRFVDLDDLPQHRFLPKQVVLFAIVREHSMARQRAALEIQQAGISPSAP